MNEPRTFPNWRTEPERRWRDAFHAFGHLMLTHARDGALSQLPDSASDDCRAIASKAVTDALYNMMMIFEGVVGADTGTDYSLEFALVARVRSKVPPYAAAEEFELAPNGVESACMGFHLWTDDDFTT